MHAVLWIKFALANLSLLASLYLPFAKGAFLERPTPRLTIVGYYAFRLAVLAVFFLGLHFRYPGENTPAYMNYGNLVLHGYVPNRDFFVLYGILFSYFLGAALLIWHHPFVLFILFQLTEFLAIYAIFTQKNVPLSLRSFLVYAVNPVILVWMWLGLQNQAMCLVPVAVVFLVRSDLRRSVLFAFGFAISKVFSLWTIIPALGFQRIRSILFFGLVLALIYGPFLAVGSQGFSSKATEADGSLTDNAKGGGVESLIGLIPSPSLQTQVAHFSLLGTAGGLFLVALAVVAIRWKMGTRRIADERSFEQKLVYTSILATLMMLIYQAFSPYTAPDYLATVVAFSPMLIKSRFWSNADQVIFAIVSYLQAVIYLFWFHFAEFGNKDMGRGWAFVAVLILGNVFIIGFCLRSLGKAFVFFRRENWTERGSPAPVR